MSEHDDFDINITQIEDSELTEKEYSDILGLEGMAGGGEAALEENEEEKKRKLLYIFLQNSMVRSKKQHIEDTLMKMTAKKDKRLK